MQNTYYNVTSTIHHLTFLKLQSKKDKEAAIAAYKAIDMFAIL